MIGRMDWLAGWVGRLVGGRRRVLRWRYIGFSCFAIATLWIWVGHPSITLLKFFFLAGGLYVVDTAEYYLQLLEFQCRQLR